MAALTGRVRERAISTLAARQHGVVARRQLLDLGLTARAIQYRLSIGRLHLIYRGVYAVGHRDLDVKGRWLAAVIACGKRAVLSHRSAARLWGIADAASPLIDVTSAGEGGAANRGIRHHRTRQLAAEDTTTVDEIPVTTVARTLFDLAEVMDLSALEGAFEAAERNELLDMRAVLVTAQRNRGRRAHRRLNTLLPSLSRAEPTRSELEHLFQGFCLTAGLPLPKFNVPVEGFEVDALWAAARLVVEVDGWEFHKTRAAFERDRVRDAALLTAGYRVIRVTYRRLRDDPSGTAQAIRGLLATAA